MRIRLNQGHFKWDQITKWRSHETNDGSKKAILASGKLLLYIWRQISCQLLWRIWIHWLLGELWGPYLAQKRSFVSLPNKFKKNEWMIWGTHLSNGRNDCNFAIRIWQAIYIHSFDFLWKKGEKRKYYFQTLCISYSLRTVALLTLAFAMFTTSRRFASSWTKLNSIVPYEPKTRKNKLCIVRVNNLQNTYLPETWASWEFHLSPCSGIPVYWNDKKWKGIKSVENSRSDVKCCCFYQVLPFLCE